MKVYCVNDTPECILTGIYQAFYDKEPNQNICLELTEHEQFDLFSEKIRVTPSYELSFRVMDSVRRKLGSEIEDYIQGALCANMPDKADAIFRYMQTAFYSKRFDPNDFTRPEILRVFELNRKSRCEVQLMKGFTRFEEIAPNVFFARIGPVNDVLPLMADHFVSRFNTQAFMIYDEKRKKSVVYSPGHNWYFAEGNVEERLAALRQTDRYEDLWKVFFDSTTIRERLNPICQRNLCPIHFREYMNEFQ